MNHNITKISIIIFLFFLSSNLYSQKFGLGVAAVYNFQTNGLGASLRAEIPRGQISLVPQIAYYPSFNEITELYAGLSLHLNVVSYGDITLYGIANASYNGWFNYDEFQMKKAKLSNIDAEVGLGLKKGKCLRPFTELRYNFKWKEANFRIGIMYFFNCDKKGKRKKKAVSCPAYDN